MNSSKPSAAAPDLALSFDTDAYFQANAWFYNAFGVLPRREIYQLAESQARQQVVAKLAETHDVEAATVAHSVYIEKVGKGPEIGHYALNLAPHLLLCFFDRGPYGDRTAQLLYSPQADATLLAELRALLTSHLETGQLEHQRIQVLRLAFNDLEFTPLPIKIPALDLATHYNDDLLPAHETILRRLQQPEEKGIVILHGPPGTGKTSYIRHLCGLTDKPKLSIPPNLAARIADPEFINLLHDNTNSILLIEDAEELLSKRDGPGGNAVSNLLNLSDGLLSDGFHIQIVCTFNAELARIDKALLRKGRLIASYRFEPLTVEKAQALATAMGQTEPITEPTSLADLYNRDKADFVSESKTAGRIGFNR
ncbi:ATP-binding protein [Hymenobacter sp. M29]|uniref:ATP-binding protein n=1 Tax=Hymenobacter mellowenesis TaxID=3063995 RepID=A0ABT9AJ13_9BACT|nr:ATP-binding protein [Hymenobacter sp. M29]MDO7849853.1 ATP-binding protein [Hymenobacter sp. M29]